jgi:hypothetical protein
LKGFIASLPAAAAFGGGNEMRRSNRDDFDRTADRAGWVAFAFSHGCIPNNQTDFKTNKKSSKGVFFRSVVEIAATLMPRQVK